METERCEHNSLKVADYGLKISRGHWSLDLDQKKNVTEPALINPTDLGTKLLNKWLWISQNPVIFVLSVPLREENWEAKERERNLSTSTFEIDEERRGNLLQEYEQRFEQLSEDQKLAKLWSEAGLRFDEIGQYLYTLAIPRGEKEQSLSKMYDASRCKGNSCKRVDSW